MPANSIDTVLASGDVDELRRLLQSSMGKAPEEQAPSCAEPTDVFSPPPNIYSSAQHIVLTLAKSCPPLAKSCPPLKLVSTRVMGKVVWPAGHAISLFLWEHFADGVTQTEAEALDFFAPVATPTVITRQRSIFLEVGAGSGTPALVAAAACSQAFPFVVATDFTEAGVQLLEENKKRNGSRMQCARLDVSERAMLAEVLDKMLEEEARGERNGEEAVTVPRDVQICACDMSYDEDAIDHLFASVAVLCQRAFGGGECFRPEIWFARSSNFEHMDTRTSAAASEHGFVLVATHRVCAGGVQDALSATYLTPCVDEQTDLFVFREITTSRSGVR